MLDTALGTACKLCSFAADGSIHLRTLHRLILRLSGYIRGIYLYKADSNTVAIQAGAHSTWFLPLTGSGAFSVLLSKL